MCSTALQRCTLLQRQHYRVILINFPRPSASAGFACVFDPFDAIQRPGTRRVKMVNSLSTIPGKPQHSTTLHRVLPSANRGRKEHGSDGSVVD